MLPVIGINYIVKYGYTAALAGYVVYVERERPDFTVPVGGNVSTG